MLKNTAFSLCPGALAVALMLAGCGGGGGTSQPAASGQGNGSDAAVADMRVVSGSAAKGTIRNARVQIFSVDANGEKGTAIASTTTGIDGTYQLQVPASLLTFTIEVDGASGGTFADEATGMDVAIPADFRIRDVVRLDATAAKTFRASISPLTELIVATAEKSAGGLTAANIDASKAGFATAYGFDAEKVRLVDANSAEAANATEEEKLQSLTLAAISKLAKDGKLGCDQATTGERINCVVRQVGKSGKVTGESLDLDDEVRRNIRQSLADVVADASINRTGKTGTDGTAIFAESRIATGAGSITGVQAAKNLFASLRNNSHAAHLSDRTGPLDSRIDSLRSDFRKAVAPVDGNLVLLTRLSITGIEFFQLYKSGGISSAQISGFFDHRYVSGSCRILTATRQLATSKENAASVSCNPYQNAAFAYVRNASNVVVGYQSVRSSILMTPSADNPNVFAYRASSSRVTFASTDGRNFTQTGITSVGNYGAETAATGTIAFTIASTTAGNALTSASFVGNMPARVNADGVALSDREAWSIAATRTDEGNTTFRYALAGTVASIVNDAPSAQFSVKEGSFVRISGDQSAPTLQATQEVSLILEGTAGSSTVAGAMRLTNFSGDKNGNDVVPTMVTFAGSLSTANAEFFSGKLGLERTGYDKTDTTLPTSASNYAGETASFAGKLTIAQRPDVSLTATLSRPALNSASILAQYRDGTETVNISVTDSDIGVAPKKTHVADANGVSADFVSGAKSIDVLRNGAKIAVIDTASGKISYVDGSFESLD